MISNAFLEERQLLHRSTMFPVENGSDRFNCGTGYTTQSAWRPVVLYVALKEKFGLFVDFEFLTEMGSWGTDYSIPVGLRKILQRKVVENGVRKKRPRTGISRGNARDAICAFKFAPSRHAFDLYTFFRLTRALCRSLVVEGSVVHS